jgi:Uma2 family endonuclease
VENLPLPREITVPEAKPAFEWILGRAVQKVSPKRRHSLVQAALLARIGAWATGRGEVGPEWRFRLEPTGEAIRPLVPDVAYLSYERAAVFTDDELEAPLLAPDVAVEIRSIGDRQEHIDHKIGVYLACGTHAVIVVDPYARRIDAYDANGTTSFTGSDRFTHSALPGLTFTIDELFAVLERPR